VEVANLARAFNAIAGQIELRTFELGQNLQALKDNESRLESRECERTKELETIILYAAISETSSNRWKSSVISVFIGSA